MAARRQDSLDIARFGDALRYFLGLDPLYQSGERPEKDDETRFYIAPYPETSHAMTPRRGASCS